MHPTWSTVYNPKIIKYPVFHPASGHIPYITGGISHLLSGSMFRQGVSRRWRSFPPLRTISESMRPGVTPQGQMERSDTWFIWNHHPYHTYIHTYIHTYLHTYIPTYLHTYIPTYLHTYIPTYLHTYIPTYLHTYIPTYLHTYIPTYLHTYIPTYLDT